MRSCGDPDQQRRGYGEAVTRKALYEGVRATGLTRTTLHATVTGARAYPRIGFEPNSPTHFYTLADRPVDDLAPGCGCFTRIRERMAG